MSRFPAYRPRRLRRSEALRRLVRETRLSPDQLVQPLFVVPGERVERPVESMPGVAQRSVDRTAEECRDSPGEGERRGDETHLLVGEAQIPGDEGHQEAGRVAVEEQEPEGDAEQPDETLFVAHVRLRSDHR